MSLKMPALCFDASLDTLQPLCCRRMHWLQGDLSCWTLTIWEHATYNCAWEEWS